MEKHPLLVLSETMSCICLVIDHKWPSKFGKNKKVAHKEIAEHVTDILTTLWGLLWSITEQTHSNMECIILFHIIKKQTTTNRNKALFLVQNISA